MDAVVDHHHFCQTTLTTYPETNTSRALIKISAQVTLPYPLFFFSRSVSTVLPWSRSTCLQIPTNVKSDPCCQYWDISKLGYHIETKLFWQQLTTHRFRIMKFIITATTSRKMYRLGFVRWFPKPEKGSCRCSYIYRLCGKCLPFLGRGNLMSDRWADGVMNTLPSAV